VTRPVTVIVNELAGSTATRGQALDEALARAGLDAHIVRARGAEILAAARRAASDGHVLVAAGGDGTVSTVAGIAVEGNLTLGVLPLGTLNHFARDAGIPSDLNEAAAVISAGHTRDLDVGGVNGRTFLNNMSLGLYPRLVWEREAERSRGRAKWSAFAIALARTWRRYPTITLRMTVDGAPLTRRTPFVFVGNGKYHAQGLDLGRRDSLDGGMLSVYLAPGVDRLEFLTLPVRALLGRLSSTAGFESFSACEVAIDTRRPFLDVAVDGELTALVPPIRCASRPRALRTLVPEP
jgi:diacylglycerol kinase family enzyme